jgi:hypothetical protein
MDENLTEGFLSDVGRTYVLDSSSARTGNALDVRKQFLGILDIYPNVQFNHLRRLQMGSYSKRVIEYDITKKVFNNRIYNYWSQFENSNHLGDHPAASEYVDFHDTNLHVVTRPIFTHTYQGITHDMSAMIESARTALLSQLEFISFDINIFGRSDLNAGDLIVANLSAFSSNLTGEEKKSRFDRLLSGRWMITQLHHKFSPTEQIPHMITARIAKDAFRESVY